MWIYISRRVCEIHDSKMSRLCLISGAQVLMIRFCLALLILLFGEAFMGASRVYSTARDEGGLAGTVIEALQNQMHSGL